MSIDAVLQLPDVQERVQRYFEQDALFQEMLVAHTWTEGDVVVTDLRGVEPIYSGNRFLVYALHPEQNVSIWIVSGFKNQNCVFACGHSILNKTSEVNVGALMRRFGGGGHAAAGTCQVPHEEFARTLEVLVSAMNQDQAPLLRAA